MDAQEPTDCIDAVIACGNSNVTLDVNGIGTQELNNSNTCSSQENNSIWLKVSVINDGTLGFTLTPNSTSINEDYDFFVFGPNVSCGNIGQAIRCSTTNPLAANQGNNLTGMNSSSNDTAEGPGQNGNSFVKSLNVVAGDTYFIVIDRPIGNSPFSLEWTGTAKFSEPPTNESTSSGTPLNLEKCDISAPFTDGLTSFNLSQNTPVIIGAQKDVTATYHTSASDANIGINEILGAFSNTSNPQIIYTRITNDITGCYELVDFNLIVNLGPDFNTPSNYALCDNADDGNDQNGQLIFDLTTKNDEILDGQPPSDFNITYYTSTINAETKIAPLPDLYYNATPFDEGIYVRIEDKLNPNCKSITTFKLIANLNPIASNYTIIQCDEDTIIDGITLFNLEEANASLTNNIANRSLRFFKFLNDAENEVNEILNADSYKNESNPQTLFVQVINDDTGCKNIAELTLEISTTQIDDYEAPAVCDELNSEDGINTFNLDDITIEIQTLNNITFPISYFKIYEDALTEHDELPTTYNNTTPYSQIIFARAENDNACYGISEVLLTINPLPNINTEELTYYCLNKFPETITINADVLNDNPTNYTYSWSNGDTSYTTEINEIGIYTVDVTNSSGCTKQRTITVEASDIAAFQSPDEYIVKDPSNNNTITVFASGLGTYQYALFDKTNTTIYRNYQDSSFFENVAPGIYTINVKDIKNNCGIIPIAVSVIGFPKFFTPNNDNMNDRWQIIGTSSMFQAQSKIRIFDRYGKLVKQLNPIGVGWDGLFNGEKLPADDYWFAITLQDGRVFKNHFTLKY